MNSWTFIALLSLASIFFVNVYGDRGDARDGDEMGPPSRGSGGKNSYIRRFLRVYCHNAPGDYKRCERCVDVGCLRYMRGANDIAAYDECVADNNRCCTQPGVGAETFFTAGKCYATGLASEILGGQLSVARSFFGGQAKDAPRAFQARKTPA